MGAGHDDQRRGGRPGSRLPGAHHDRRRPAGRSRGHHRRPTRIRQLGGRLPLTPLLHKIGTKATLVTALIVAFVAVLLLLASHHLGPAIGYTLLGGASTGALYTLQGIYTNELVGHQNRSLLMGAQQAVFAIGGALGPVIAGAIFQSGNSYTPVVLLTGSGFLISAFILGRRSKPQATASSISVNERFTIDT